jgi:transposase-like protein
MGKHVVYQMAQSETSKRSIPKVARELRLAEETLKRWIRQHVVRAKFFPSLQCVLKNNKIPKKGYSDSQYSMREREVRRETVARRL